MYEDLISIIVAVYNVKEYLDKCVTSIVNQTYCNLEIILVDDGSTDGSAELCDSLGKKDSRIVVIHKKNGGLSDARNVGIEHAHGKWIGFIDGDDYITETMFQNLYDNKVYNGMVICGFYITKKNSIEECMPPAITLDSQEAVRFYISNEVMAFRNSKLTFFGSYAWNKLYDISLFKSIRYPKGKKFEDIYIILDLIHESKEIKFISSCEYYYIQRETSITHSFDTLQIDCLEGRKLQRKQIKKWGDVNENNFMQLIAFEYFSIIIHFALLNKEAKSVYKKTKEEAYRQLKSIGYDGFTFKMRIKLFLCLYAPRVFKYLRAFVKRKTLQN